MSKHPIRSGDVAGLLNQLAGRRQRGRAARGRPFPGAAHRKAARGAGGGAPEPPRRLQAKAQARTGKTFPVIVIQEAGLEGFWLHRVLEKEGIESHVVDAASILTSRRRRRAKTDRIDGEALLRTLLAYKRGEPRVCAMVRAPTPQEEDRRRLCRERKTLVAERVEHVNRIKGLLFARGIADYEPLHRDRRQRLEQLTTGDGRPLPAHLKAQIGRELDRLELLLRQLKAVEAERDALLAPMADAASAPVAAPAGARGAGPPPGRARSPAAARPWRRSGMPCSRPWPTRLLRPWRRWPGCGGSAPSSPRTSGWSASIARSAIGRRGA